jgi:hypothetical protein
MRRVDPGARRRGEAVAGAAHGLHHLLQAARLERLAQAADVHVDGALLDVVVAAPHVVEQLRARVDAVGVRHEEMQQPVLGGADVHRLVAGVHAVRGAVQAQPAHRHRAVGVVVARAAQHGLDARQQLARRERLDHVVVGTQLQSEDPVDLAVACGEHDDRYVAGEVVAAPAAGQVQAAHARQHPVEQDQVRHALGDRRGRLAAVAGVDRLVVALAQGEGHHVADGRFVIDDEDAFLHGGTVSPGESACK